jgi:hypothetical protein
VGEGEAVSKPHAEMIGDEGRGAVHVVDAYKVKPEPRFVVQASSKLEAFVHMQRTLAAYKLRQN